MGIQSKLLRPWRVCATGLAFVTFILGCFFLTLAAFPIIRLLRFSLEDQRRSYLQLIHWSFRLFIKYILCLKVIDTFEVEGLENIQNYNGCFFIANHPTLIDVVAIMSCVPYCNCIIKKSLLKHFFLGSIVRAAGFIANDHATQLVQDCEKSFQAGYPLIIFPEGTRSPPHGLHTFKRGAAQIALRTGVTIVLVVITCDPPTLLKGQAWYKVPERMIRFKMHFYPLLSFPHVTQEETNLSLKVRALNQYLEDFFRQQLHLATDGKTD